MLQRTGKNIVTNIKRFQLHQANEVVYPIENGFDKSNEHKLGRRCLAQYGTETN